MPLQVQIAQTSDVTSLSVQALIVPIIVVGRLYIAGA